MEGSSKPDREVRNLECKLGAWKITCISSKETNTEEIAPMKLILRNHSAFRTEVRAAKILIDPFLSVNSSRDNGWKRCLKCENSTHRGEQ
jgi:hypothetical protein